MPSLSELLETLCVELRGHPHSARTASSSRLRWDRGRSRPSAECALADDGRLRRAPPKLTYVNHIRLGASRQYIVIEYTLPVLLVPELLIHI